MEDDRFEKGLDNRRAIVAVGQQGSPAELVEAANVVKFPLQDVLKAAAPAPDESALKNFYIRMALSRFHNTVAQAAMQPAGSIPQEEYEFLRDLGRVLDYVAKLELQVAEQNQRVDSQPADPKDCEDC